MAPAEQFGPIMLIPIDHVGHRDRLGLGEIIRGILHEKPKLRITASDSPVAEATSRSSSRWVMDCVLCKNR